ncbi:MAG: ECF transporter S component, partial [Solirubrobacteraceae bacterium]
MSWQLASFAILALALGSGFAWYERSRPSSRTVALVATLAALATLGRLAFAALPDVKPMTDIVLLTGYALGGAPGFTVGAVSAIASNVVLSEGPWTPWQMLAWGLVGVAGAIVSRSRRGRCPPRRLTMALICAIAGFGFGFVVYLYTWLGFSAHTLPQYLAVEASAFPFNLTHAIGNAVFYLAFGPAFLRALRRFRARLTVEWGPAVASALLAVVVLAGVATDARAAT